MAASKSGQRLYDRGDEDQRTGCGFDSELIYMLDFELDADNGESTSSDGRNWQFASELVSGVNDQRRPENAVVQ
jgi:hypothetical protein